MKSVEQLKKEIESEFAWYTMDNGHEPNVAYVKCQWFGDDEPEDLVQTIALDKTWYDELSAENGDDYVVPYIKDEEVLYYCSSIDSLTDLLVDNGVSDFKVVEFVGFEYLENEKD